MQVKNKTKKENIKENIKEEPKSKAKEFFGYAKVCIISALIAFLFVTFIGKPAVVVGSSMEPTLNNSDLLFVEKITKEYKRFDIIIFKNEKRTLIKRVIALPGETVQIVDNNIYINGRMIEDPIKVEMEDYGLAEYPITLNDNEYFVMGDNRNNSLDSRFEEVGIVHTNQIIGHILFGFIPFNTNLSNR